jgi:hypothetical protein
MNVANCVTRIVVDHCDFCAVELSHKKSKWLRETYPEWFEDEGVGNLRSECIDILCKAMRDELNKNLPKLKVWEVECGFCAEPIRLCADHLRKELTELEKDETNRGNRVVGDHV